MSILKPISFSAVALLTAFITVTEARADHSTVMGLPVPGITHPTMGMPVRPGIRPPVVGLPIMPRPRPVGLPIGPRPPFVGIVAPHPVGLPLPPRPVGLVVGMPIRPPVGPRPPYIGIVAPHPVGLPTPLHVLRSFELECHDTHRNVSGINKVKLELNQTSANSYDVNGFVGYSDGSDATVNTIAYGSINRGRVNLQLEEVGSLQLNPIRVVSFRQNLQGEVALFGTVDRFGLSCQLDQE